MHIAVFFLKFHIKSVQNIKTTFRIIFNHLKIVFESFKRSGPPTTYSDSQKHIQKYIHNITYIYCCFLSQTSHLISPEHQEHLQNYFEPPENSFRIIQTPWTTNNTFARPKIHSKTHSQYNIYIAIFFLKLDI